eukprot:scaffold11066_cov146-Isochrysis_galbana.AAC.3
MADPSLAVTWVAVGATDASDVLVVPPPNDGTSSDETKKSVPVGKPQGSSAIPPKTVPQSSRSCRAFAASVAPVEIA